MAEVISASSVEAALDEGRPLYVPQTPKLLRLSGLALQAALTAHEVLYGGGGQLVIEDPDSGVGDKYITLADVKEVPLWQDETGAPDLGIRGINPNYEGDGNRTTVLHVRANDALPEWLASSDISSNLGALRSLGCYAFEKYTEPYLRALAEVEGVDPETYLANFGPGGIMRAILYHEMTDTNQDRMPVGTDFKKPKLAIKEHCDKGSFTADVFTTGSGLQYFSGDEWRVPEGNCVAIFPGAGDRHLKLTAVPTIHRVVHDSSWPVLNSNSAGRVPNIVRAAFPLFISSTNPDANKVIPGSAQTHPTYS